MRKNMISVVLSTVVAATILTACRGQKNAAADKEMVSDNTFAVLQENYAVRMMKGEHLRKIT